MESHLVLFLLSFLVIFSFHCISTVVVPEDIVLYDTTRLIPIEVTSLGRVASIGEFYDVRTDQFSQLNLFKNAPPSSTLKLTENKETKLTYTLVNSFQEKFTILDVSAELQFSILSGLINLKGSGHFFKDTKTSAKSAKASLVESFSTVYEQVSILDTGINSSINYDVLSQIDATHVVVGIQWGGNVFISVEDRNQDNRDVEKVEGSLGIKMKMMFGSVSGKGSVNLTDSEKAEISQFSFELYGDLVPEQVPQTIFDALEFMRNSPKLALNPNNNKGKAIKYLLLPVDALKKLWGIKMDMTNLIRQIDMATIKNCVKLYDDLQTIQQELNDVTELAKRYRNYISTDKNEKVNDLRNKFDIFYSEVTMNLSQHLVNVRSGSENISVLRDVLVEATGFKKQWQMDNQKVLSPIKQEITTLNLLQKENVSLFDKQKTFSQMLWENRDKDLYVLFFTYDINLLYDISIGNLKNVIDNKNKNKLSDLVFAVSYELIEGDKVIQGWNKTNKICVFKNGALAFDNYPYGKPGNNSNPDTIWSIQQIQAKMQQFEQKLVPIGIELQRLGKQIVPIGSVYVQYPYQQKPEDIWTGTKWENASPQYHGTFFRVEGDGSTAFETVQASSYPQRYLDEFKSYKEVSADQKCNTPTCTMPRANGVWSVAEYTGDQIGGGHAWFLRFKMVVIDAEVRPRNLAIRIWKRIQ